MARRHNHEHPHRCRLHSRRVGRVAARLVECDAAGNAAARAWHGRSRSDRHRDRRQPCCRRPRRAATAAPDPVALGGSRDAARRFDATRRRAPGPHGRPGDERGDGRDCAVGRAVVASTLLRLCTPAERRALGATRSTQRRRLPCGRTRPRPDGPGRRTSAGAQRLSRQWLERAPGVDSRCAHAGGRRGVAGRACRCAGAGESAAIDPGDAWPDRCAPAGAVAARRERREPGARRALGRKTCSLRSPLARSAMRCSTSSPPSRCPRRIRSGRTRR